MFSVNSSRGNKYYGHCAATSVRCMRPANHEAAPDTETDSERWAPPLKVQIIVVQIVGTCYFRKLLSMQCT